MGVREYGLLFSNVPDHEVCGGFVHWTQAALYGEEVAGPGVDYVVLGRIDGGPWEDVASGVTLDRILART